MKTNYHTHTARCGHALGTDEEYVINAVSAGFSILGFADHVPYVYEDGSHSGMPIEELDGYISSISQLKERMKNKIRIYIGMECESIPRMFGYLGELRTRLDYLILGNHGDFSDHDFLYAADCTEPMQLRQFLDSAICALDSGLFSLIAHPDIVFNRYPVFDNAAQEYSKELIRASKAFGIPLEYNLLGIQKHRKSPVGLGYPCREFWETAAKEGASAVIGLDAHDPGEFFSDDYEQAVKYLKDLGISPKFEISLR